MLLTKAKILKSLSSSIDSVVQQYGDRKLFARHSFNRKEKVQEQQTNSSK